MCNQMETSSSTITKKILLRQMFVMLEKDMSSSEVQKQAEKKAKKNLYLLDIFQTIETIQRKQSFNKFWQLPHTYKQGHFRYHTDKKRLMTDHKSKNPLQIKMYLYL
jgi:hypothetical protein